MNLRSVIYIFIILTVNELFCHFLCENVRAAQKDPWQGLETVFPEEKVGQKDSGYDPWTELRKIFMPFTRQEEEEAVYDPRKAVTFSYKLAKPIFPYMKLIEECSGNFGVPKEVIGAVILVESGGNPAAKAKTSSARGLMQTIRGTFRSARRALSEQGIYINNDPFNPRSSIYAGSWYLRYVFDKMISDNPGLMLSRLDVENWKRPVKYYYAGPGDGAKKDDIIIKYIDGKKLIIDKQAYCDKVMRYARLLKPAL
jgi:soluble lytic murein transglycosylase-like protein